MVVTLFFKFSIYRNDEGETSSCTFQWYSLLLINTVLLTYLQLLYKRSGYKQFLIQTWSLHLYNMGCASPEALTATRIHLLPQATVLHFLKFNCTLIYSPREIE